MIKAQQEKPTQGSKGWQFLCVFVIYQLLWHVAIPWVLFRLWLKGKSEPAYLQHIAERFGFYSSSPPFKADIWIHAVSMGETRAATPLIEELLAKGYQVLLSHMTASGRSTSAQIFASAIERGCLRQVYLPYDFCWPVTRFFRHFQPSKGLLMETEVWPGLLVFAQAAQVPIYLINGRLSNKSLRKFKRFGALSKTLFQLFTGIAAQSQNDQAHYLQFDVKNIQTTGNLKFDVNLSKESIVQGEQWRRTLWPNQKVLMAASTREGEEQIIIQAFLKMQHQPKPLLLMVPRHLQRVSEIIDLAKQAHLRVIKRSEFVKEQIVVADILIGDTFGEMAAYYAASDLILMGGTFGDTGGQNLIEPCALGKPVILGPSTYNFSQVSTNAIQMGAAVRVGDYLKEASSETDQLITQLAVTLDTHLAQPERLEAMGSQGRAFTEEHQGATKRVLNFIDIN